MPALWTLQLEAGGQKARGTVLVARVDHANSFAVLKRPVVELVFAGWPGTCCEATVAYRSAAAPIAHVGGAVEIRYEEKLVEGKGNAR